MRFIACCPVDWHGVITIPIIRMMPDFVPGLSASFERLMRPVREVVQADAIQRASMPAARKCRWCDATVADPTSLRPYWAKK